MTRKTIDPLKTQRGAIGFLSFAYDIYGNCVATVCGIHVHFGNYLRVKAEICCVEGEKRCRLCVASSTVHTQTHSAYCGKPRSWASHARLDDRLMNHVVKKVTTPFSRTLN